MNKKRIFDINSFKNSSYCILIAKKRGCIYYIYFIYKNVNKIENCLKKLSEKIGFTLTKIPYKQYLKFKITNTQLYNYLTINCGEHSEEKRIPLQISKLSKRQLKILFDVYIFIH